MSETGICTLRVQRMPTPQPQFGTSMCFSPLSCEIWSFTHAACTLVCSSKNTDKAMWVLKFSVISSKRNRLFQKQVAWQDQGEAPSHRTTSAPLRPLQWRMSTWHGPAVPLDSSQSLHELPNTYMALVVQCSNSKHQFVPELIMCIISYCPNWEAFILI